MALKLMATCSECYTSHKATIDFGQENIQCPVCGHAMKNLPEGELSQIETTIRSQRNNNIVALICLLIAVVGFFLWVFHVEPQAFYSLQGAEPLPPNQMHEIGYPVLAGAGLLATLVFAVLGARKRFVLEF